MAERNVQEIEIDVTMPDGVAGAVLYVWPEGPRPGVIHYPDGIGLRQSQRDMARRLAMEGFSVLLPNIYYRHSRPPFFPPQPDFSDPETRARFDELRATVSPTAMDRDAGAYIDFLLSRPEVAKGPIGVAGFCFTGAFAMRTAAARPQQVVAVASFHGGRLFTDDEASPHLLLPNIKARLYFGHARDDHSMPAEAIAALEAALAVWGGRFESETYDALHGWTTPDSRAHHEAEAERAFGKLRELFAATLL